MIQKSVYYCQWNQSDANFCFSSQITELNVLCKINNLKKKKEHMSKVSL